MAHITVRLGKDVVQQLEADDLMVFPGQLRFYRQRSPDIQELVMSFNLDEVTGVTVVGPWQGRRAEGVPANVPIQFVE